MPVVPQQPPEGSSKKPSARDVSESFDPRIKGMIVHDFDAPRPKRTSSQHETAKPLTQTDRPISSEKGSCNSRLPRELLESRFQENFSIRNDETTTASKMTFESHSNTGMIPISLFEEGIEVSSGTGRLNETTEPDANRAEKQNETPIRDSHSKYEEDAGSLGDDMEHPCEACGQIVSKAIPCFKPSFSNNLTNSL
jgi:hypothetical protein